jgi:hypothetical protein
VSAAQKQTVIGGHRLANQLKALKLENWTGAKKDESLIAMAANLFSLY